MGLGYLLAEKKNGWQICSTWSPGQGGPSGAWCDLCWSSTALRLPISLGPEEAIVLYWTLEISVCVR